MTPPFSSSNAFKWIFQTTGKPTDVLEIQSFTPKTPADGEVLIKLLAAPINPADLNTIEGVYGSQPSLPAHAGSEGCGEVIESRSSAYQPGDRVIFLCRAATWATHVTISAQFLLKLPPQIDPVQASMLKVNPATAWQLLHAFYPLTKDHWIVQNASNSAVGRCVIQLARDLGLRCISFARRPEVFEELKSLGANWIFPDNESGYHAALQTMQGANASLAFNAVGGDSALRMMKLLRNGGSHVTYGAMAKKPLTVPNGLLIFNDIHIRGLWVSRWIETAQANELQTVYKILAQKISEGTLVQAVDSIHSTHDLISAIAQTHNPNRNGKIILCPSSLSK